MSKALYNKYRPQKFSEVVNQNHVKITLQNEIATGKIAQAYLFAGPRGIGKTTVARIFAKALNCLDRQQDEPCGVCANCLAVQEGKSFDLVEIDAASNRGINEIRELREHVKYPPTVFKYKVFIIDEAHMLTIEAFNALLKTLEEPPKHAIFILATTEIHKLPETIISRCQRFDFRKVKIDDIVKLLQMIVESEKIKMEPGVLENIARHSEGYVRDAVSLLGQILSLNQKEITAAEAALVLPHSDFNLVMELAGHLFKKDLKSAIELINRLVNEGIEIDNFIDDLVEYLRKILLIKVMGGAESLSWELDKKFIQTAVEHAEVVGLNNLLKVIDLILTKVPDYKYSKIVQLPLEILAAEAVMIFDAQEPSYRPPVANDPLGKTPDKTGPAKAPIAESFKDNPKSSSITLAEIGKCWVKILDELKNFNHSLSAFVKASRPVALEQGILTLGFQYKFQQEKIAEAKNKIFLGELLEKNCGCRLSVECVVDDNYQERESWSKYGGSQTESVETNKIAEEFGGEVMEN